MLLSLNLVQVLMEECVSSLLRPEYIIGKLTLLCRFSHYANIDTSASFVGAIVPLMLEVT